MRLRLNLKAQIFLEDLNRRNSFAGIMGNVAATPSGGKRLIAEQGADRGSSGDFGVPLMWQEPNRLKQGDLRFSAPALSVAVPLTGAATVADLVARVGQATRLELYADPRVGRLRVWHRGERARAGDLLHALCLAVTGTFRRVGGETSGAAVAFVLTDNVEGILARRTRLAEWDADRIAKGWLLRDAWKEQTTRADPMRYLRFAPDDAMALSDDLLGRLRRLWESKPAYRGVSAGSVTLEVPTSELSPALRAYIRAAAADPHRTTPLREDRARIDVYPRASFIVPGISSVDAPAFYFESLVEHTPGRPDGDKAPPANVDAPIPSLSLPRVGERTLLVALTGTESEEAAMARLVRTTKERGFTQLWVQTPNGEEGRKALAGAIAAGKKEGLMSVLAMEPLLSRNASGTDPPPAMALRGRNVFGETNAEYMARRAKSPQGQREQRHTQITSTDWLRPELPETAALVKRRIASLLEVSGLAGLALRDSFPPGYLGGEGGLGFTDDLRLEFLRHVGYDPVDLDWPTDKYDELNLPFFPRVSPRPRFGVSRGEEIASSESPTPAALWDRFRQERAMHLMADIHRAFRSAHPDLSLLHENAEGGQYNAWFGSWDRADALPRRSVKSSDDPVKALTEAPKHARTFSRRVLYLAVPSPPRESENQAAQALLLRRRFARSLTWQFSAASAAGWDGLVLDVSALSAEQALLCVEALTPASSAAVTQE